MTYVMMKDGGSWTQFRTSSGLRMETIIYDRGGVFMPGEYDLEPVPVNLIVRKPKRSLSAPLTPKQSRLVRRRHTIPGVRPSARSHDNLPHTEAQKQED
jgi:hypothetical protein